MSNLCNDIRYDIRNKTFSKVNMIVLMVIYLEKNIILDKQQMSLETDVLQFSFKKNSSTVICTSMLKETIDDYNENKTDC